MTADSETAPGPRRSRPPGCVVVGLGASAGGLEAFRTFLTHMRPESGMAFVLIQHLDPQHKSLMHELLSPHTAMRVQQAEDGMAVEPNRVYIIPPNALLTLQDGALRVTNPENARASRTGIDVFFRSLAEDQGDNAVAVILSGIGHDGALGLKAVKEQGGLTIAQEPGSARNDAMPRHAISTGFVDDVLPVEAMPARLLEYAAHLTELRDSRPSGIEAKDWLPEITGLLKERTAHEFTHYKRTTLVRRIQRRIQVLQAGSVERYVDLLRTDAREAHQLVKDLLIGVTNFFRDAEAFRALSAEVLVKLWQAKPAEEPLRVWVAGCASGEEAYSLAMLVAEHTAESPSARTVQIFATDIDDEALETARQARYPESISEHVSEARLQRFFVRDGGSYQVTRALREMCIFSQHNLIRDPPFSRLDLISCRNLLIYLEAELQHKVLSLFHYALNPGGYLFLGPSENVTGRSDLFRALDKRLRIFQKKRTVLRSPLELPFGDMTRPGKRPNELARRLPIASEEQVERSLERLLIDAYAPPCIIINEQGDIVYFSGRTGKYLEPPSGALNVNIVNMVVGGLRADVRAAVHRTLRTRESTVQENISVETHAGPQRLNLIVRALDDEDGGLFVVLFQELGDPENPTATRHAQDESQLVLQLESELKASKEHLQTTIEELETSNEELKSSNEELLSMNEELQSLNEEFETVNAELKAKVEELDNANNDLQNLLLSTRIPTVFLDAELNIRRFTPAATEVFHLIDSDIGRPITHMAPRFDAAALVGDARDVLYTLQPREREVVMEDGGCCYLMRTLPYRTLSNVIAGVVITFVDISHIKEAERQQAFLAAMVESAQEAVIGLTAEGEITSWNKAAEEVYGYSAVDAIGRRIDAMVPPEKVAELAHIFTLIGRGEKVRRLETVRVRRDGQRIDVSLSVSPVYDSSGRFLGASKFSHDISRRKRAEADLDRMRRDLADFVENASVGLHWVDGTGIIKWANRAELVMLGYAGSDYIGHHVAEFHAHQGVAEDVLRRLMANEELHDYPAQLLCKDGGVKHVLINSNVFREDGEVRHTRCFTRDVTAQVRAEAGLRASEDELRRLFENAAVGMVQCAGDSARFLRVNPAFCALIGYSQEELLGMRLLDVTHPDDAAQQWEHYEALQRGDIADFTSECRYVRKDGRQIWAHTKLGTFRSPEQQLLYSIGVVQDVTTEKLAQTELIRARELAEEASRAKDRFMAVLSHELRTPLSPVLSAAAALRRRDDLPAEVRQRLAMIQRNVELEARLIDDLLDLTRISRGKLELKPATLDCRAVIEHALEICSDELDAKSLRVEVSLSPGDCWVRGDAARLQQVLWNLLKNSIKFSEPESVIQVRCSVSGEQIVIEVQDQGAGIEPAHLPKIFDAFEQGGAAAGSLGGLGLGLAISQALVQLHDGSIEAESAGRGRGALFRIKLPSTQAPVTTLPRSDTPVSEPQRGLRILLVEDHEDTANMMTELLGMHGHQVTIAQSVKSALAHAHDGQFDLLVSDLGLPDGSGLDILLALRQRGVQLRAIALSGYGMESDRKRTTEAGFAEHLVKPVAFRDLQAAILRVTSLV
jgi:two-component system CheB/CheR fusion protein